MNKINALSKETFKLYDNANVALPAELIIYIGCCEEFLKLAFQVSALCLLFRANAWNVSLANFMVANLYFQLIWWNQITV